MGVLWGGRRAAPSPAPDVGKRSGPVSVSDYFRLWAGGSSYADVNASSPLVAMQSIAVRGAIDLLASLVSELPFDTYAPVAGGDRKRKRQTPGYMQDPGGDGNGVEDWRYQVMVSWLTRGNMFGEALEFDSRGAYPTQIDIWNPDSVSGYTDSDGQDRWQHNGMEVTDLRRFVHRRVNPMPGEALGLSPIRQHADSIGQSIASSRFGLQWFKDGAHPSGILSNEEVEMTPDLISTAKERFLAAVFGSREPLVLGKGWKYSAIQVSAEESQFLATMGFSEGQCARMFGPGVAEALGYESGGSLTYATVESRARDLLTYTVNRWLRRMDRFQSSMMPSPWVIETDRDALLQSTTLDKYKAYHQALVDGWRTINEIRTEDENKDPVAWGNEPFAINAVASDKTTKDDPDALTKEGDNA